MLTRTLECYIANGQMVSDKPRTGDWQKYYLKELIWIEYDYAQRACMLLREDSREWVINKIKLQRLILEKSLLKIELSTGDIIWQDPINCLSEHIANLLYSFYNKNCFLTDDDISSLDEQVSYYNDATKINKIKPPYNKMIIILDLIRHFGGLTLQDICALSKRDLDTLYILARLGLH